MKLPEFTLGVEEEFQVIDPETRQLQSNVTELFRRLAEVLPETSTPELHRSVVEIGTPICHNIGDLRREVTGARTALIRLAREQGLCIAAAGTHPKTRWQDVETTKNERYAKLLEDLQIVARANVIFGLHIHVGIEDKDDLIHVFNMARYFVPHLMALSANSPFWCGEETGWSSYRSKVFEKFPRTGIPSTFESFREYEELLAILKQTNSIDSGKSIWWDVRPHWRYPTIEFRCFDVQMRAEETVALAALCQALVAKLYVLHKSNLSFRLHKRSLIMENKWRAARWGLSGRLIDLGKMREVETPQLLEEILVFVDEVVDDLGLRDELQTIRKMMKRGTGADRQLAVWRETNDLNRVVDTIVSETEHGLQLGSV